MTRKLATIRRIKELVSIPGADRIELAIVDGWQVVTQKAVIEDDGTVLYQGHKVGDLVVFYEIDSFLPSSDARYASFSDRFSNWGDKHGMRLRTIKLRKQLSQGLILRVAEFPELFDLAFEGADVTDALKIEKWEPIEKASSNQPGQQGTKSFPAFIRKTDQERVQNYGHLIERELDTDFEVTVKKDGSSMSVFRVDPSSPYYDAAVNLTRGKLNFFQRVIHWGANLFNGKEAVYGICSRNVLLPLNGTSNFHKAAEAPLRALRANMDGVSFAIQGEVVAPDIQGNYEKVESVEFHMFDLFCIDTQSYFLPNHRRVWAAQNAVDHVRVLFITSLRTILALKDGDDVVKKCLTFAEGPGDNEGVMREGVVLKAMTKDFSFKCISNSYLLHKG